MADEPPPDGDTTSSDSGAGSGGGSGDEGTTRTFSQEDLDRKIESRLEKERRKFSDYEELKAKASQLDELEASNKSDIDKATERASSAEARAQKAEAQALRLQVAFDKGLTPALAKRLSGDTKEDLEADADEILEAFPQSSGGSGPPPSNRPTPDLKGGTDPTDGVDEPVDPDKLAAHVPRP